MQEPEVMETQPTEAKMPEMSSQAGNITKIPPSMQSQEWLKYGEQVSGFLSKLPDWLTSFFFQYKQPLLTVGIIVAAIVAVKVVLAVLDALNDIPLVAPTFEMIGIGYSAWFVYRYLLKASTRQELTSEITTLKSQVVGRDN
jgi:CAAD domains of cyanobacterial aminoacyl-tRNA synthetase